MIPMHCVTIAAGDIHSLNQVRKIGFCITISTDQYILKVYELGYCGYDAIVLGRRIIEV